MTNNFMKILEGQYIPANNEKGKIGHVMLVGEKPSNFFLKNPKMKHFGNYNNPKSQTDIRLQKYVRKYLGRVFITDMVKTEGISGANFEAQWHSESIHKRLLLEELRKIKPKKIGALGRKVEKLLLFTLFTHQRHVTRKILPGGINNLNN